MTDCITKSALQVHKFLIPAAREQYAFNKPQRIVGSWSEVQTWDLLARNTDALRSIVTHRHRQRGESLQVFNVVEHRLTTSFNI